MKYFWDFIFGVLVIGGLPWSFLALAILVGDSLQKHAHLIIPDAVAAIVWILSLLFFLAAVAYRVKKRLLPKGYIVAEIFLGAIGAFLLLGFYGVMMHFIID